MRIRRWLPVAWVMLISLGSIAGATGLDESLEAHARAIHQRVLKLDSHVDVLLPSTPEQLWAPGHESRADLGKLRAGGIGAVAFAIAVGPGPRTAEGYAEARLEADAKLEAIRQFVKDAAADAQLALSAADVERIHRTGRIAVIESFLNARSIGTDPGRIDELYRSGVRLFGFVHAGNNDFADSSRPTGEPREEHHGLSPLGQKAVARLNHLGVIIDVSQLTPAGVRQVLALSKAPVVASHSAVRALVDSPRNLSDEELEAIGAHDGVVQVTAFNSYLVRRPADYRDRVRDVRIRYGLTADYPDTAIGTLQGSAALPAERLEAFQGDIRALFPKATVRDYVDHIDYIVKRIGIDHVGIGSDFNHGAGIVGFDDESQAFNVTLELVRRGYTEPQIAKIWGRNFLRVFRGVEAVSKQLRSGAQFTSRASASGPSSLHRAAPGHPS